MGESRKGGSGVRMAGTVGIGLAGCGRIARMFHLPVLAGVEGAALVAVADGDERARAAAHRTAPEAAVVEDWRELLTAPGVDALVVCLPTGVHAEAATAALRAGRHVYVEKPLATSAAQAAEVVAAWRATSLVGAVGFNFRFHPLIVAAREALAAGVVGEVVGARTVFCSPPRALPAWKRARASGGGVLLDLAAHHVDTLRLLLGEEVAAVTAALRSVRSEDDTAALTLRHPGGVASQVLVSLAVAQQDRIEVLGTKATLALDRMRRRRLELVTASQPEGRRQRLAAARRAVLGGLSGTIDDLWPPGEPSFAHALEAFTAAVATGSWTGASIEDGYQVALVLDAAERAVASGRIEPVGPAGEAA